jgi:hypothetical protein
MLDLASKHVRNCQARAADCRRRANAAIDDETRAFWRKEEERWLKLAESESSERNSVFLESEGDGTFSPEAEDGVATLVRVFNRACVDLNLDLSDETLPRKIARTIIVSAIDGESDPERLYQRAIRAVSN